MIAIVSRSDGNPDALPDALLRMNTSPDRPVHPPSAYCAGASVFSTTGRSAADLLHRLHENPRSEETLQPLSSQSVARQPHRHDLRASRANVNRVGVWFTGGQR